MATAKATLKKVQKAAVYEPKLLEGMYRDMCLFRRFEERVNQAYVKQKFSGFLHLHIGQEALCVGVQKSLKPTDYLITGYRSHTQAIAKGIEPKRVLAELFGKVEGCSRGKGGSMHMFSKEHRFLGGHGIVGGQVPIGTGVGFAIKYRKEAAICVCYLGDAATNQGQFFEALNMAATWNLPVLYIIENNRYGMGTDIHRTTSVEHLWQRALAFDMDHSEVDGMDVLAVYDHMQEVVDKIRKTSRPHLVEALTYRYKGHSISDPGHYRTKEELQTYMERDAIKTLATYLKANNYADDDKLKEWDEAAKTLVREAEAFADEAKEPELEEIWQHVYAP